MIRILLADDHSLCRAGLKQLLEQHDDIRIEAEASTGGEVLEQLRHQEYDLLLLDISMPGVSGSDLIGRVRTRCPQLPILVLSMYNEPQLARRKLKAGAAGYITKDTDAAMLVSAIRKVAAGGHFIAPDLAEQMVFQDDAVTTPRPHTLLTERELQILRMLVKGKGLNEIASELTISNKTVSTHKVRMMRKMNITSNAELIRYAITHGITP